MTERLSGPLAPELGVMAGDTTRPAQEDASGLGWLALWLFLGPVLVLVLAQLVFFLSLGYSSEPLHPQDAWHALGLILAVLLARTVWCKRRALPALLLLASAAVGILVARGIATAVPRWLLDELGEGVNRDAALWVAIPQTATLLLVSAAGWAASYGVLYVFVWYRRKANA